MTRFDVLGMQRAVRRDQRLTVQQKALLWAAALRADNETGAGKQAGHVHASLQLLAKDAALTREDVSRQLREGAHPELLEHIAKVKRHPGGRRVDLYLHVTQDHVRAHTANTAPARDSGSRSRDSGSRRT